MAEQQFTVVGNICSEPELRFIPNGAAVANFVIASSPRTKDANGEWKDGDPLFMPCNIWRDAAEHVADSLTKGTRVIAVGKLKQRSYEKDGVTRKVVELEVEEIGPSLRYATAKVSKAARGDGKFQPQSPAPDPWGSSSEGAPF